MDRHDDDQHPRRTAPAPAFEDRSTHDRPAHPTAAAALLLVGVTLLVIALAALSAYG